MTVFELLTASFAADNFSLRENWKLRYEGNPSNNEFVIIFQFFRGFLAPCALKEKKPQQCG
ncbi:hypothetical protein [Tepidanaerobacter sp. EBM-49]|uniref:hypothetical protein n=1 Tax=Tepidanaerobacter sp. EBM-49 TaxID=1918504 RepID=UPI000A485D30|nr:hypothetical protein [Tepidanaerobacter sp. EBM-49]